MQSRRPDPDEAPEIVVELSSTIGAPAEAVWARAISPEGINDELRPWLRMTMPKGLQGRTVETVEVGKPLGRSWLLLFGLLPVDYDELCLTEVGPEMRFQEDSTMLTMSRWRHERSVEAADGDAHSCTVTDRLGFELRRPLRWIPGSRALVAAIIGRLFGHRHARLSRRWTAGGGAKRTAPSGRVGG